MQQSTSTALNVANQLAVVDPDNCPVIEWSGLRVVTTETLAVGYGCDEKGIRMNLSRNLDRFEEGKHYFLITGEELKSLKNRVTHSGSVGKNARSLTLWTEKGAARMSKIVDTDEAWSFFERLEDSYFRPRNDLPLSAWGLPNFLDPAEAAIAWATERKAVQAISFERDEAIETKAWIGKRREATSMATASIAVREKNKLAERLGESKRHAAIIPVEKRTGLEFKWQPLRKWCRENGVEPHEVEDKRFGTVKSWPRAAWLAVYDIDLRKIF
ncbi:ORF6N domain-containing protein [Yersinia hibernica]|uniref:ORF6N domain-containing protein n=1 Tax=Yersinia hibernica TaxID=2339259 RepID=UPI00119DEE5F|nr:ORF6N domain-containing protein [Yersinia hibernica]